MRSVAHTSVRFIKENLLLPFLLVFQLFAIATNAQCITRGCEEFKSKAPAIFNAAYLRGDVPRVEIKVHPNPNPKQFILKFEVPVICDLVVRIADAKGLEVYREELKQFKGYYLESIKLTHLPEGTYFVHLDYMNITQSKRMVTY